MRPRHHQGGQSCACLCGPKARYLPNPARRSASELTTIDQIDIQFIGQLYAGAQARPPKARTNRHVTPKESFGWYELHDSDTKAAGKFYSDVVGGPPRRCPPATALRTQSSNIGNVGNGRHAEHPRTTPHGLATSRSTMSDAHIEKIVEAGGKL